MSSNQAVNPFKPTPGQLVAWAAVAFMVIWVYHGHVFSMVENWWDDENYSHGFLVPLISAWLIWRQRGRLERHVDGPSLWGLLPVAAGVMILMVGQLGHEFFLRRFSLIPFLWGLCWTAFGWGVASRAWFAFAYLIFMVPLPYMIYDALAFPLRLVAASMAGTIIRWFGVPVLVEGNVITLPSVVLNVIDACSGIRSLISLGAAGAILAYIMLPKRWLKVVLMILVVPVAVLTNSLRVVISGLLAEFVSPAFLEGTTHDMLGWVVFMVAFVLLALITYGMKRIWDPKEAADES